MPAPPDDRGRPVGEGGLESAGSAGVAANPTPPLSQVEVRCDGGRPCDEITLRLIAADRSQREGFPDVARKLRETAEAWARHHDYGQAS
jgi:hypothetical protein